MIRWEVCHFQNGNILTTHVDSVYYRLTDDDTIEFYNEEDLNSDYIDIVCEFSKKDLYYIKNLGEIES